MTLITLDLHQTVLYGWERKKNPYTIESICKGIYDGDTFPPVPVVLAYPSFLGFPVAGEPSYYIDDCTFREYEDTVAGGHHRAYAHWLLGKALLCDLLFERRGALYRGFPISEIELLPKDAISLDSFRLKKLSDRNYK